MTPKVRLYLDQPLAQGQLLEPDRDQANYLFAVMRLQPGDAILAFNGRDGEWIAEVNSASKRGGQLVVRDQTRPVQLPPDLWLLFAPIKKARTDFIVEKATEMGAARILPVQTDFTNAERIRQDRLQAHATEAAEQCGGTFVPEVADLQGLAKLLAGWDPARRILWCDEARVGSVHSLAGLQPGPWAILIGPEGGFSPAEQARLAALPFVQPVSLGPRILRADTAAVAALALWAGSPWGLAGMSFIRPEVQDFLSRWQGVIASGAVALAGLWIGTRGGWLLGAIGIFLGLTGLALARDALQRLRFAGSHDGPGMVEVDEGQIAWYGPGIGGFLSLADLSELGLITVQGMRVWRLVQSDGQNLLIPVGAEGTDRLYSALTDLPGIDGSSLLAALASPADRPLIWQRQSARILPFQPKE